jgi:DNA mismatch repair protein MSH5
MAYKRRCTGLEASSNSSSTPQHQSFSRLGSVPQKNPFSSLTPPQHSQRSRLSLRPPQLSLVPSLVRDQNTIRAHVEETDEEIRQREDADHINETIMAIDMRGGNIGCAYYIAREETLHLMQDIKFGDLDIIDTLKLHAEPSTIIISSRAEEKLEAHLRKEARGIDRDDGASETCLSPFLPLKNLTIRR